MGIDIVWSSNGWEDFEFWLDNDRKKMRKIRELIRACKMNPFDGIGKPEPLKENLSGSWSRRIDTEHRLVYYFEEDTLYIVSCRHHYEK